MPGPCGSTCCTGVPGEAGRRRYGSCRTCCTAPAPGCRIRIAAGRRRCASIRPGCCRSGRTGHGASGASSARSAGCRRHQVTGLVPAAERAGGYRRPVAAAAPGGPVVAAHGQRGPPAVAALLVVGRVMAEAPAADRVAGHSAASDVASLPATAARFEPVPVIAATAAARSPEPVAQRDCLPARRAGRGHDPGDAGVQQRPDEHVDARRAVRSLAGEQHRALVEFPEHLVALERAGDRARDHVLQPGRDGTGAVAADVSGDGRDGIGTVVGPAAGAARSPVLVAGGDLPGGPAD